MPRDAKEEDKRLSGIILGLFLQTVFFGVLLADKLVAEGRAAFDEGWWKLGSVRRLLVFTSCSAIGLAVSIYVKLRRRREAKRLKKPKCPEQQE